LSPTLLLALFVVLAYLVGSIPFGYVVSRARGVDILRQGSGNIGATNVGRVLGRRWGILVFLLDFAKGALPVLLAGLVPDPPDLSLPKHTTQVLVGVAAFLGHLFPVYLGFRGGKGVATGAGVVVVLVPIAALLAVLAWAVVLAASRYMSAASLTGAVVLCVVRLLPFFQPWDYDQIVVTIFCLVGALLVVVRHAGNIRRLIQGTENRL
jgi:acyl-phosphate glycerol 3-phosphate acyltransferase